MNAITGSANEADMIGAFFGKERRERWKEVLSRPKGRKKFLERLCHENDIDPSCMTPIPHDDRSAGAVYQLLKKEGAPESCHIVSCVNRLDGKEMSLLSALEEVVDHAEGTIISCIPGRLAYYFSEERNGQYILRAAKKA